MTLEEFRHSLGGKAPPAGLSPAVEALWLDAHGDWEGAHARAQGDSGTDGSWVHAYLHRKEGDEGNAGYWYSRARRRPASGLLGAEWDAIAAELLSRKPA